MIILLCRYVKYKNMRNVSLFFYLDWKDDSRCNFTLRKFYFYGRIFFPELSITSVLLFLLESHFKMNENRVKIVRVSSGPRISGNLEKSEFCGTWKISEKSQGISWNLEKSRNFNVKLGKVREFYLCETNIAEVFSNFIQVVNKN